MGLFLSGTKLRARAHSARMNPLAILRRCFLLPLASTLHNASTGCRTVVARTRTEPRDTNPKRVANGLKGDEKLVYILANTRADGRAAGRPVGGVEDTKVGAALRLGRVASEPRVVTIAANCSIEQKATWRPTVQSTSWFNEASHGINSGPLSGGRPA